ncbi:hypothetical protein C9426_24925 [Serratia sp. S1B]|nr:hypothetical protein C9426_24925 [Serratia sp. S1B]
MINLNIKNQLKVLVLLFSIFSLAACDNGQTSNSNNESNEESQSSTQDANGNKTDNNINNNDTDNNSKSDDNQNADTKKTVLPTLAFVPPGESFDLNNYMLAAQYDLPVGSGKNLLAAEISAVTYNWDTDTLFGVGDGGTAIVQLSKQGVLLDSMALPADTSKPAGTYFYDTEGIAYVGGGKFVLAEERYRQLDLLTYTANTTFDPSQSQAVKLGTTIGNIGIEGVTYDPATGGFIAVKEKDPMGIFFTTVDYASGTASNGSPTTENSVNLFDPELISVPGTGTVADLADVYALSNVLPAASADYNRLLLISEESGQIVKMDRQGNVYSSRYVEIAPLHAQLEGITLDKDLNLYLTAEKGTSGKAGHPQLWRYEPTRSAEAVGVNSHLYLTFPGNIKPGEGKILLQASSAANSRSFDVNDSTQVSFKEGTVTIAPSQPLAQKERYQVIYASGTFITEDDNAVAVMTADNALTFTTADSLLPITLAASTPMMNATQVATNSAIQLQFSKTIQKGQGALIISNGGTDRREIAIDDPQITIDAQTMTFQPSTPLQESTQYTLTLPPTALLDTSGNPLPSEVTLTFSTQGAVTPDSLIPGDILFVAAIAQGDPDDAFAFMLMRDIKAGTEIYFSDRDSLTATNEGCYLWTATQYFPAGTIITVRSSIPAADKGSMQGAGGGLGKGETVFAFQGIVTGLDTSKPVISQVDRFIAGINFGGSIPTIDTLLQSSLGDTPGAFLSFSALNVKYNGSLNPIDVKSSITDQDDWLMDNSSKSPFVLDQANSLFPE